MEPGVTFQENVLSFIHRPVIKRVLKSIKKVIVLKQKYSAFFFCCGFVLFTFWAAD